MENEIITKRRVIIILVMATVVIFVGLVWLIATIKPWELLGAQSPTITASLKTAQNCTYPRTYWKAHPELYPPQMVIGGIVYKERELEALLSDDNQDTTQQIKVEMAVAFLNSLAGADQSPIETTLFEAYGWLVQHPTGSQVTEEALTTNRRLYDELVAYNLGLSGIEPCEAALSITQTGISTATPTYISTATPSPTGTPTPSETPTAVTVTATATYIYILPTSTAIVATEPPHPVPTNTPVPTTPPPTPTKTAVPATPTFTPPPPPTPTSTPPKLPASIGAMQ